MRNLLRLFCLALLVFFVGLWASTESTLNATTEDKAQLQAEYDTLKIDYETERQAHRKTGQSYVSALNSVSTLEQKVLELQSKIAELERKLGEQRVIHPTVRDAAFWRRLADCENPRGDAPGGYFQFMGSTREKVGWRPGLSYEQQRAMAISWAAQIHPNEGTTAGWPVCWHRALRG